MILHFYDVYYNSITFYFQTTMLLRIILQTENKVTNSNKFLHILVKRLVKEIISCNHHLSSKICDFN